MVVVHDARGYKDFEYCNIIMVIILGMDWIISSVCNLVFNSGLGPLHFKCNLLLLLSLLKFNITITITPKI